jgi:hypothetical protein
MQRTRTGTQRGGAAGALVGLLVVAVVAAALYFFLFNDQGPNPILGEKPGQTIETSRETAREAREVMDRRNEDVRQRQDAHQQAADALGD